MACLIVQEDGQRVQYELKEGENLIGRHPDSALAIVKPSVSGRHAMIHVRDGSFIIEDIGSRNGTFVNQDRISSQVQLKHNDMVQFGDAVARFENLSEAPAPRPAASKTVAGAATVSGETTLAGGINLEDSEATITGEVGTGARFGVLDVNPEAKLKAVLEISQSLAGTADVEAMLPKILSTLFSVFHYADRGCILLKDAKGEMVPRAMRYRQQGEDASVRLSRTVVNKVLTEKTGILSADAATDTAFDGSASIADLKIRSMMCVPLLGLDGEPTGVLSIDSQNPLGQFTKDDLDILLTVAGQAALSYESARLMQSYAEKQKQDNELKIAQTVQRALLPDVLPTADGYEFFASYDAAQAVGGDYYDCFDLGEGKICLSFGDVAGKGVPGALIMSRMSSCVQSTIRHVRDVVGAISAINDHMCDTSVEGRFVTYVLAFVDTLNHTVELSNAGHMAPAIRRADGSVEVFDEELTGTPIGVMEDYPYEAETRQLNPGDMVVIVTDGVDEAMNYEDELYGGERLLEFVKNGSSNASELGKALLADVRRHANGRPQNDDITIMTFGRNPLS